VEQSGIDQLAQQVFRFYLEFAPVEASQLGESEYDHLFPDRSRQYLDNAARRARNLLAQLQGCRVVGDAEVDRRLLEIGLWDVLFSIESQREWDKNPVSYVQECLFGLYVLLVRQQPSLRERLGSICRRAAAIEGLLSQAMENLERPPRVFVDSAIELCRGGIGLLQHALPAVAGDCPDMASEVERAVDAGCRQLQRFQAYLEAQRPGAAPSDECAVGEAVFNQLLKRRHLLDYDAGSLSRTGHRLLEETLEALRDLAGEIDGRADWLTLFERICDDHPTADDLVAAYRREMESVRDFVSQSGLVDVPPREELRVIETPEFIRPMIPYAAYLSPDRHSEPRIGHFFVTPVSAGLGPEETERLLRDHPHQGMAITALHEGYPGHHLQSVYASRIQAPARIMTHSTLFIEGWAFYCEELLEQAGYLNDPRQRLLRLKDQLWRACRIVVDAGLHSGEMTFDEAVAWMRDQGHLAPANALSEVRRYAQTPTQPMSYLMGKLEILDIAARFRERAGSDFSLRQFHRELLCHGSIPPTLLRRVLFDDEGAGPPPTS